ncbi:oligosaccharide flippase family protein [Colwellia sp. TT2012]|uniref:oligosaccharide flippase family protein n=1 Tax=Colwellia sp. TT2012 TaxID=1720342 RepID=UPI00070CE012|nr:oligosaccharide flippase family protein [Colwellia sp. TT2012]
MTKINKELNKAILHSLTGKYSLYIFQILSLAILSRIFTPEMFGILAALQVIVMFFQLVATSSLGPAVVYADTLSAKDRDGIFSFTLLLGLALVGVFFISADSMFVWLGLGDDSFNLTIIVCFVILASSASMLPVATLQKDSLFIDIAKADIYAEFLAFVLCITLFYLDYGFLALASKFVFVPSIRFFFYYLKSSKTTIGQPRLGRSLSSIKILLSFAKYQLGFNLLNYFSRNLDTILITKYFGVATVGLYEKSYQVMRYPLQLFTFAITPALQPVLTKYKHQVEIIEKEYYPIAFKLAMLGFFVSWVLFWGADEVIYIMFGPQWHEAGQYLSLLAVSIPLQMVLSSTGGIYQAVGQSKSQFYCGIFSSIVNVTMIIVGVYFVDLILLCQLLVVGFVINFIQCFWVMQTRIFKRKYNTNLFLIFCIVLCPYVNLLFLDLVQQPELSLMTYQSALYHLCLLGLSSLAVTGAGYVVLQKLYWK